MSANSSNKGIIKKPLNCSYIESTRVDSIQIKANDITVDDVTCTNDITVSGDVSVTGDITCNSITASSANKNIVTLTATTGSTYTITEATNSLFYVPVQSSGNIKLTLPTAALGLYYEFWFKGATSSGPKYIQLRFANGTENGDAIVRIKEADTGDNGVFINNIRTWSADSYLGLEPSSGTYDAYIRVTCIATNYWLAEVDTDVQTQAQIVISSN